MTSANKLKRLLEDKVRSIELAAEADHTRRAASYEDQVTEARKWLVRVGYHVARRDPRVWEGYGCGCRACNVCAMWQAYQEDTDVGGARRLLARAHREYKVQRRNERIEDWANDHRGWALLAFISAFDLSALFARWVSPAHPLLFGALLGLGIAHLLTRRWGDFFSDLMLVTPLLCFACFGLGMLL